MYQNERISISDDPLPKLEPVEDAPLFTRHQKMLLGVGLFLLMGFALLQFVPTPQPASLQLEQMPIDVYNNRPIIGVVTLPCEKDMIILPPGGGDAAPKCTSSYLAASYVKSIEAAGGRVVPLHFFWEPNMMREMLAKVNGVLFTGGDAPITPETPYFDSVRVIFDEVVKANDQGTHFPLWGTCLGYEAIMMLASDEDKVASLLSPFDALNISLPLDFTWDLPTLKTTSKLFAGDNLGIDATLNILSTTPVCLNNHVKGVSPAKFSEVRKLHEFFSIIATNEDREGETFISLVEAKKYPVWGAQFHPEKVSFEWYNLERISHTREAVFANQYFMNFFVNEARKNWRSFGEDEKEDLIYADAGKVRYVDKDFVQCYFW